jgi:hypothetical protein
MATILACQHLKLTVPTAVAGDPGEADDQLPLFPAAGPP